MNVTAVAVVLLSSALAMVGSSLSAKEAMNHLGEKQQVCGEVASTDYAMRSRTPYFGRPRPALS